MKYLKKFNTEIEYTDFTESDKYVLPNVSWVVDGNNVLYNPAESGLVYNMVDLGLPSGLLWADRNVGAASPEDAGLYFAWGETKGYTLEQFLNGERVFNQESYLDGNYSYETSKYHGYDMEDITLKPEDDAATVHMGENWRMPSYNDIIELFANTTQVFFDKNNNIVSDPCGDENAYVKFTGSNGNSIVFYYHTEELGDSISNLYISPLIWLNHTGGLHGSATNAECGSMHTGGSMCEPRHKGIQVRGVCKK